MALLPEEVLEQLRRAKDAARKLAVLPTRKKNEALLATAELMEKKASAVFEANRADMESARAARLAAPLLKRLEITEKKLAAMIQALRTVAALDDPVGQTVRAWKRPNGLEIAKVRIPLGVLALIYESRPDATADVAALALKSGNAAVLRGGKEALRSNQALVGLFHEVYRQVGVPMDGLQLIASTDRAIVDGLLQAVDWIDVVIPRGGESLIRAVVEKSKIPVIFQYKGVCHQYVDEDADLETAVRLAVNAKTSNPAVCNALECLLVHEKVAAAFLPKLAKAMQEKSVLLRACPKALPLCPGAQAACDEDWGKEYLDLILAVKVVASFEEAVDHIHRFGTRHSEAIVTKNWANARRFLREVDAACVYVNASTRFTDGGEFGFGAEVGISTQKLHARGPMGLEDLTGTKYCILGEGHVRE